jgi:hypothetical protein
VADDDLERLALAVIFCDLAVGVDHSGADEDPDVLLDLALQALIVDWAAFSRAPILGGQLARSAFRP